MPLPLLLAAAPQVLAKLSSDPELADMNPKTLKQTGACVHGNHHQDFLNSVSVLLLAFSGSQVMPLEQSLSLQPIPPTAPPCTGTALVLQ